MDKETRGFIEKAIDDAIRGEILVDVRWIEDVLPIKSLEDLALGYMVGLLWAFADGVITLKEGKRTEEDRTEIIRMLERRILEIRHKILTELGT